MASTPFDRRSLLKGGVALAGGVGAATLLSACGVKGTSAATGSTLKIGYVSPQTGALASFATADNFVVGRMQNLLKSGISAGGSNRTIEIIVKDTQSDPNRATQVTQQLITQEKVDIVVASGTPDTSNPVADACEAAGVPNLTTIVPWEAWFFGRGMQAGQEFKYSTMFFFGMDEFAGCFFPMWQELGIKSGNVAALWPNDTDANAFRSGFAPLIEKAGYKVVDAGKYNDGATDFSAQIAKFKAADAELFTCTPIPPDFQTYWKQANQQGFKPKLATVAKVMLFPSEAESLGQLSNNIATDIWWSPFHPYQSALESTTAKQLAADFASSTGKQWTQALGSVYSLFEIAVQAFKGASDPHDHDDVADQLKNMKISCMSGDLDFTAGPQPGIAIQKPVGGQWRPGTDFPWDITIVNNQPNPAVTLGGDLRPTYA